MVVILSYSEYLNHINNCKYNNNRYICNVRKYNYDKKQFEECHYTGNKEEMKNHFNLCGKIKFQCIFCKEDILQMNLEEHIKNKCKFGIINYPDGKRYIGETKNNIKEGYGKLFYNNGNRYEGEFKNDLREGYGIFYFTSGDKYEGEFKNNLKEGYGILYYSNGTKYVGEFKNNKLEGIGAYYYSNGSKYLGELKNNRREGYGIKYYINGDKYKGQFKNGFKDGYGIKYYFFLEINMSEDIKRVLKTDLE